MHAKTHQKLNLPLSETISDRIRDYQRPHQRLSTTTSETISDNIRDHLRQVHRHSFAATYALMEEVTLPSVTPATYALPMCCCDAGKRRLLPCHLCAVATLGSVASYPATYVLM